MERGFGGRHHAVTKVIGGVYENVYHDDPEYQAIQSRIADYTADKGRAPHVLVAKMGQDGHDRGAKVIATAFADMGFKVDLTDMFETPAEVTDKGHRLGVDVVGVSSLAAGHKSLVPELIDPPEGQGPRRHPGGRRRRDPGTGLCLPARKGRGRDFWPRLERAGCRERGAGADIGAEAERVNPGRGSLFAPGPLQQRTQFLRAIFSISSSPYCRSRS
jgi:methylmalonyl-CoA mutase cobalamin-binding subunit